MAEVRLSDVIDVEIFRELEPVNSPELSALFQSGVVTRSPLLDEHTAAAGFTTDLPFWNDLDADSEPNIGTDDPNQNATPDNVDQGQQTARKAFLNNGWSATDLASDVAMGPDAMTHIRNRTDTYWTRQWQRRIVASAIGVLMDNVANDNSDMVHDISSQDGNNATDANLFSRTAFTAAAFTLGDRFESTTAIGVHSHVYQRMVDNDDVVFIPDSQGNLNIPTFLGRRIIIDDGTPVIQGTTSGMRFVSVLFGEGAIGYGEAEPKTPMEIDRDAKAGNGQGIETLWQRRTWTVHPFGYRFLSASLALQSGATLAELRNGANWDRVVPRKNVPLAFLITN